VSKTSHKVAWRLVGIGVTMGATLAARKLLAAGWKFVTGENPPDSPENPDTGTAEAVTWALASGVGVATARLLATRQAAHAWDHLFGDLPPGMERDAIADEQD